MKKGTKFWVDLLVNLSWIYVAALATNYIYNLILHGIISVFELFEYDGAVMFFLVVSLIVLVLRYPVKEIKQFLIRSWRELTNPKKTAKKKQPKKKVPIIEITE